MDLGLIAFLFNVQPSIVLSEAILEIDGLVELTSSILVIWGPNCDDICIEIKIPIINPLNCFTNSCFVLTSSIEPPYKQSHQAHKQPTQLSS